MKKLVGLLLPILAVVGVSLVSTGLKLKKLIPYFESLRIKKITLSEIILALDLLIENPNNKELTFQELIARVFLEGTQISDITLYDQNIPIPPRQKKKIKGIQIRIRNIELINQLWELFQKGFAGKYITISGTIRADKMTFPFSANVLLK